MKSLLERAEIFWCSAMHSDVMWPLSGSYRCRTCLREYTVCFEHAGDKPGARPSILTAHLAR
jgi:hypothetical protein